MILSEALITKVAVSAISWALSQSGLGDTLRKALGREPAQKAFRRATKKALEEFEEAHPALAGNLLDAEFFEGESAPILGQFLVRNAQPDASQLASRWAESLTRTGDDHFFVRDLEAPAVDLLGFLANALKTEPDLRELNDSRTFENIDRTLTALRKTFAADEATAGTRTDYLNWIVARNLYLDPRGTFQTQRQVQLRLDQIYIALRAEADPLCQARLRQLPPLDY